MCVWQRSRPEQGEFYIILGYTPEGIREVIVCGAFKWSNGTECLSENKTMSKALLVAQVEPVAFLH